MLEFTQEDIPRIREKNELKALERLRKVLEEQIDSVHKQKVEFEKGDEPPQIRKWTHEIEEVAEFDGVVEDVRMAAENLRGKALQEVRDEEEKKEEEKRKRHYEDEIKLQEAKMAAKLKFEKKMEEVQKERRFTEGKWSQVTQVNHNKVSRNSSWLAKVLGSIRDRNRQGKHTNKQFIEPS